MEIRVNGESMQVDEDITLAALLQRLGLAGKRVAVEVNARIVSASRHDEHRLQAGDRVEIIQAIGGG